MARVIGFALVLLFGVALSAVPPTGSSFLHSIPANPNGSPELPEIYQLLVGGQPGPLYTFEFDTTQNRLQNVTSTVDLGTGPSWLEFDKTGTFMFSSDATRSFNGLNNTGAVFSSRIDREGKVTSISSSVTGSEAVRVAIDKEALNLIVGTYNGGTVERFVIDPQTHQLSSKPVQKIVFTGRSVNPKRQDKPYIHDVQYSPDYTILIAVDLGTDKLWRFKVEIDGNLTEIEPITVTPGCGPRHFTWAPRGLERTLDAYVVCSLTRVVLHFEVDLTADYKFTLKSDSHSTEPLNPLKRETLESSEILLSPDLRFVVISTTQTSKEPIFLADNLLVTFQRDLKTGILSKDPTSRIHTDGSVPRNFAFDPTGRLIAVPHQGSNEISIFNRDVITGQAKFITKSPALHAAFATWRTFNKRF